MLVTPAGTVMAPAPPAAHVIVVVAPEVTGAPHTPVEAPAGDARTRLTAEALTRTAAARTAGRRRRLPLPRRRGAGMDKDMGSPLRVAPRWPPAPGGGFT